RPCVRFLPPDPSHRGRRRRSTWRCKASRSSDRVLPPACRKAGRLSPLSHASASVPGCSQLSPSGSGWVENVLYTFQNGSDGGLPFAGLIKDQLGNLYGATSSGSQGGGGTVFEMMPPGNSWKFSALYGFSGTGGPQGNLIMDQAGNLYGTTTND